MNVQNIRVGSWFLMDYGWSKKKFYVLDVAGCMAQLGSTNWLVSSAIWMSMQEMDVERKAIYLGQGKIKWYWRWNPLRDLICPFYAPKMAKEESK